MRIIGGIKGGLRIIGTNKLNIRPTKDIAKEALFNILKNKLDYANSNALDLFSGTGAISYEFGSLGVPKITSVDISLNCIKFISSTAKTLDLNNNITVIKADVMQFLRNCSQSYNIIFADPPYNFNNYHNLINGIFSNKLLSRYGLLIIEHNHSLDLEEIPQFISKRKYGKSAFSFFENID
ncbi:MAG: RsmD family RNA methyltransferase [Solitalea-like symbiont of Tyrophagus putrescentiae]